MPEWRLHGRVCDEHNKGGKEALDDPNMGMFDRGVRAFVVAPAAIVVALILGAGTVGGIILLVVAGIMLAAAITGFCPTYAVVGISTHPHGLRRVGHRCAAVTRRRCDGSEQARGRGGGPHGSGRQQVRR